MPQPQIYDAARENENAFAFGKKPAADPRRSPVFEKDPLRSFETVDNQIKTDLQGWMTFTEDARIDRVDLFGKRDISENYTTETKHKILSFIMFAERTHPSGSKKVAGLAFNLLWADKRI